MAIQRFATTRFGGQGDRGGGIRRLASRLPEMYAQRDERDFRNQEIQLQKKAVKEQEKTAEQQHEDQQRGEGIAMGTLGLTGGIAAMKYQRGLEPDSLMAGNVGYAGVGGVSGGVMGGGIAKGLGAKKRWQKSLAGAVGGARQGLRGGGAASLRA